MSRFREWDLSCKVYVGNLGSSASKYEIERVFCKYGPIRNVWVARNPPGFAFVEFEDSRDAEDSVRGLDGTRCCGTRIRVEMSSGRTRRDGGRRCQFTTTTTTIVPPPPHVDNCPPPSADPTDITTTTTTSACYSTTLTTLPVLKLTPPIAAVPLRNCKCDLNFHIFPISNATFQVF
ncbi:serine/arginine-rich splicing factor 7-like isoform X1 [Arctopsyche grandis]|uniref:serine/arginine-rich splicing factor 7-like isoform X1 n=1 Tax=Arctopsyche grandis TaxID=121162 RepID=UPI00406D7E48